MQKQSWNTSLFLAGALLGYSSAAGADPSADFTGWKALTDAGGPHDSNPAAAAVVSELTANHSASYLDDSIAPAPALLANGWNDDRFPVDESLRGGSPLPAVVNSSAGNPCGSLAAARRIGCVVER